MPVVSNETQSQANGKAGETMQASPTSPSLQLAKGCDTPEAIQHLRETAFPVSLIS